MEGGTGVKQVAWAPQREIFFSAVGDFSRSSSGLAALEAQADQEEMSRKINDILRGYFAARGLSLEVRFGFFDVGELVPGIHAEVCRVGIEGKRIELAFHQDWRGRYRVHVLLHRLPAVLEVLAVMTAFDTSLSSTVLAELGDSGEYPTLAFSTREARACPIPDPDFFSSYGYLGLREEIEAHWVPWEERDLRIFWRGETTGRRRFRPPPVGAPDDFRWLPRLHLCMAARQARHAGLFDVALSGIVQIRELHLISRIEEAGLLRRPPPPLAPLKYKARLVIDGNANDWRDMFSALLMGNCVFLVQSELGFRQWYHGALKPWQHYVPVAPDFSDLDERAEWLITHDAEAKAIAARGRDLASRLTFESVYPSLIKPVRRWLPEGAFWRETKDGSKAPRPQRKKTSTS